MFNTIKTFIAVAVISVICIPTGIILGGCTNNKKADIVVTIFPQYDWVMNILGDNPGGLRVTYLLSRGVDLHSYQPSINDLSTIGNAKLFIYVGGESDDKWVKSAINKNGKAIALMDQVATIITEHDEDDPDHDCDDHGDLHEDEHVWLSIKNARALVRVIANEIGKIDPNNKDTYTKNSDDYRAELWELHTKYVIEMSAAVAKGKDTVVIADRNPFLYLFEDYGFTGIAAFDGCSAETSITDKMQDKLIKAVNDLGLDYVLYIDNYSVANYIRNKSNATKLGQMQDGQQVNNNQIKKGVTYLSIMADNLAVLKLVLG